MLSAVALKISATQILFRISKEKSTLKSAYSPGKYFRKAFLTAEKR